MSNVVPLPGRAALKPGISEIDRIQQLSYKGLRRPAMSAELGIDERLLNRWADQNCEIRDALSVNDAIHQFVATDIAGR